MHYQIEAWKCAEPKIPDGSSSTTTNGKVPGAIETTVSKQCGRLCYRRELFMAHLHEAHHLAGRHHEPYVKEQCKKRRVGRNGQCGFWCGFCQTVVRLEKTGIEAWDERFNHIDDEHFKKGTRVEDWVPLEGEVPRGVMELGAAAVVRRDDGPGGKEEEEEARDRDESGSDDEDSGPDAEGGDDEGDLVLLEAGGTEEKTARAKAAAMASARCRVTLAAPEVKERVRRLWDCVRLPFPPALSFHQHLPSFHPSISCVFCSLPQTRSLNPSPPKSISPLPR